MSNIQHNTIVNASDLHYALIKTINPSSGVPDFIGQLGVDINTNIVYRSTGTSAGNWTQLNPALTGSSPVNPFYAPIGTNVNVTLYQGEHLWLFCPGSIPQPPANILSLNAPTGLSHAYWNESSEQQSISGVFNGNTASCVIWIPLGNALQSFSGNLQFSLTATGGG